MASEQSRLDRATEVALKAWYDPKHNFQPDAMLAALLAALPVLLAAAELDNTKTAIEIAWSMRAAVDASGGDLELNDPEEAAELAQMGVNTSLHLLEYIESIRSLYAPSLGEGDGR